MKDHLSIADHPLILDKLTTMREAGTDSATFRRLLREISQLMAYEITRHMPLTSRRITTPLCEMQAPVLAGRRPALVSILRAGNGFLDGMLEMIPQARVGFVGLYRDEETLTAHQYYCNLPKALGERLTIVVDPMLATGNSSVAALDLIKQAGAREIRFMCLVAAPEGVARMKSAHPDVPILTAALDERLNDKGYIVPGLGDAADRIFATDG